jgi:hypothetical protein
MVEDLHNVEVEDGNELIDWVNFEEAADNAIGITSFCNKVKLKVIIFIFKKIEMNFFFNINQLKYDHH